MRRSSQALIVRTLHPSGLLDTEIGAWRAMQSMVPAFANPLLGPDFSQAVGRRRADARVAVVERDSQIVGFLPYHLRPGGFARPIGSPFSDYHGLVSNPDAGVSIREVLSAAGLAAYRFSGLIDPFGTFADTGGQREAYAIRLESSPEDYLEALRAGSPKRFKNMRRLEHKLDREVGPLRITAPSHDQADFDQLVEWKSQQFRRTGLHDVLRPDWASGLMQDLFEQRDGDLRGLMITLHAGDVLVGGHFGVRLDGIYHPWLASTHPDLAAFSPGQTFMMQAILAMPGLGLHTYDLGPGSDHYKRPFVDTPTMIGEGLALSAGARGRLAGARDEAWVLAGAGRVSAVGRLRRRLDHIASAELSTAGRMRGVVEAFAGRAFRPAQAETLGG